MSELLFGVRVGLGVDPVVVDELLGEPMRDGCLLVAEVGWLAGRDGIDDVVRQARSRSDPRWA